jgi:hypothetical protein
MFARAMSLRTLIFVAGVAVLNFTAACGGSSERSCEGVSTDTEIDPLNCGGCGNACAEQFKCIRGTCLAGDCIPGDSEECYGGAEGTDGIGPCVAGMRTCEITGQWSTCEGEVVPTGENGAACRDGIDNNCNGVVDEDVDNDMDGYTTCGGDCCDSTECSKPGNVNPGAFDAAGNMFDDDCNGTVDDTLLTCDQNIASNTLSGLDFARAIDICQVATMADKKWGVISGSLTLADGTGVPDPKAHSVRPRFGTGLYPQGGLNLAVISTGAAAATADTNPTPEDWGGYTHVGAQTSPYPADFLAANGNTLPNAPGCPDPGGSQAFDPVMMTFRIRVPTNAHSFKLSINFFSAEFPEYTCSRYNDFFVVLLDSTYAGIPANPADKNLAFFQPMGTMMKVPVGVNLGFGNTGLFTQCMNGGTGCTGGATAGNIMTCASTAQLAGTGFEENGGTCESGQLVGGATGWLVTSGNVTPGEIITLRIAIWDTSDSVLDSLAVVDGFQWSVDGTDPGTVIFKEKPELGAVPPTAQITLGE